MRVLDCSEKNYQKVLSQILKILFILKCDTCLVYPSTAVYMCCNQPAIIGTRGTSSTLTGMAAATVAHVFMEDESNVVIISMFPYLLVVVIFGKKA